MRKIYSYLLDIFTGVWYNLANIVYKMGGITIKKLQPKRRTWLEYQSKKKQLRVRKNNIRKKSKKQKGRKIGNVTKNIPANYKEQFTAIAPATFSIIDNPEETIRYFNSIIKEMSKKKFKRHFFFDLSEVSALTIDAIMYIIAILRNIKCTRLYQYRFSGNQPIDKGARQLLLESGFFRYVESKEKNIKPNSNKIQITTGSNVDTEVASNICDFVNSVCRTNLKFTFYLYKAIIELMTNTIQHAYIDREKDGYISTVNHWYVFVENQDNKIKFIFLDTGAGIPRTIYKKWAEKFFLFKKDSEFIRSALRGECRTQTRNSYRGKGLPLISECVTDGNFENLYIYSGGGCCNVLKGYEGTYLLSDVDNKIFGTLFSWEISKENISKEYKI